MEANVTLNAREQRRLLVLNQLEAGTLTNEQAAELLLLSVRQVRRLRSRYRAQGAAALAHGNRGRSPANALSDEVRRSVIELATTRYRGFNQQHLSEKLTEEHGLQISRPTVHRLLKAAGVPAPRRRRPPKHRRRRDRYPRAGMLLQVDGSRHDWLEGRGPYLTLIGAIDDATGEVTAAEFRLQEDAQGYFVVLRRTIARHGVPLAIYSDRHGIFFKTKDKELSLEEQLLGRPQPTQFGRLLEELHIRQILALSPQAKGRIERLWGTFQDRLTSELRLAAATSIEDANKVLARLLPKHNRAFAIAAAEPEPAWGPSPKQLDVLFCFKFQRRVATDHTIRFNGRRIDLAPSPTSYAGRLVEVQGRFDGTIQVYLASQRLALVKPTIDSPSLRLGSRTDFRRLPEYLPPPEPPPTPQLPAPSSQRWRPPANHPWRR